MTYHAHIYWQNDDERAHAVLLRNTLIKMGGYVGGMHNAPIGPHPRPMFQLIYDTNSQQVVETFLNEHKGTLSILLHESIKDDVRDHTEGARWLGEPLPLNITWLEAYWKKHE